MLKKRRKKQKQTKKTRSKNYKIYIYEVCWRRKKTHTLCDPIDGSPPGSALPGILQARTLEWVAIAFSIVWKWKVKVKLLSRVRLLATPWTAAYQAPPSMGFSRQEYWSGVPLPSPVFSTTGTKFGGEVWRLSFCEICCICFGMFILIWGYRDRRHYF